MSMDTLSIVIPAFNEARRLPPTLKALRECLATLPLDTEVVVVDDGSTDDTAGVCKALLQSWPALRVLRYEGNRGKGHAVRYGMLRARGSIRILIDADGSTPATELSKLIDPLRAGTADVVIGSRYVGQASPSGQPTWRVLWSRACNGLLQQTLIPDIADPFCGFKGFTAAAASVLFGRSRIDGWAYDLEILAMARRDGSQILEVPVAWHDDRDSRVRPLRDFGAVAWEAFLIHRRLRTRSRSVPSR